MYIYTYIYILEAQTYITKKPAERLVPREEATKRYVGLARYCRHNAWCVDILTGGYIITR